MQHVPVCFPADFVDNFLRYLQTAVDYSSSDEKSFGGSNSAFCYGCNRFNSMSCNLVSQGDIQNDWLTIFHDGLTGRWQVFCGDRFGGQTGISAWLAARASRLPRTSDSSFVQCPEPLQTRRTSEVRSWCGSTNSHASRRRWRHGQTQRNSGSSVSNVRLTPLLTVYITDYKLLYHRLSSSHQVVVICGRNAKLNEFLREQSWPLKMVVKVSPSL